MFKLTLIVVSFLLCCLPRNVVSKSFEELVNLHPDFGLNIVEFFEKYNYPYEVHQVKTDDDYLLTVHRITNGRFNHSLSNGTKPVVFMMHGLLSDATDFVNMGPNTALAFRLADEGYDVWLLNMRGTTWSRNHTHLNPNNNTEGYWNFSFHEVGYYDLPASIDYVLQSTKMNNLTYIGFSEGTTVFMVMTSTRPEYNKKINLAVTLAPVAYIQNATSPLMYMFKTFEPLLEDLLNLFNVQEILPKSVFIKEIAKIFCNENSPFLDLCIDIIYIFGGGFDKELFNKTIIPIIGTNDPAGTSRKTLKHYLQFAYTEYFRQYDYGEDLNKKYYNNSVPPSYDISKISAPIYIFHAKNDFFSSLPDVNRLVSELPNLVGKKLVEWDKFSHVDFLWANNLNQLVNNDVIDVINKFNNNIGDESDKYIEGNQI